MQRSLFFALCILAFCLNADTAKSTKINGTTFDLPDNWQSNGQIFGRIVNDVPEATINVSPRDVNASAVESETRSSIEQISKLPGAEASIVEEGHVTLANGTQVKYLAAKIAQPNMPGEIVILNYILPISDTTSTEVVFITKETNYKGFKPEFDAIIASAEY